MQRVKIDLPAIFRFKTDIPLRITDLNYGLHVGNDTILSIFHEARVQFLHSFGYTEMALEGTSLIMSDVMIQFKSEAFYPDILTASVDTGNFSRLGFDIYYKLEKMANGILTAVALAKTGMICYDYKTSRMMQVPETLRIKLT